MAAHISNWFCEDVLPLWKKHTISMDTSPEQLEQALLTQACNTNKNALLYSAKIRYTANIVPGEVRTPLAENDQPYFIGTARICLLLNHLAVLYKSFPIFTKLKQRETGMVKHINIDIFKNPLKTGSQGFSYSNGTTCICVFARFNLIIFEEFVPYNDSNLAEGGLNFLFINPMYADQAVKLVMELLEGYVNCNEFVPGYLILDTFLKLMAIFKFPTIPASMNLIFCARNLGDIGKIFNIFFPGEYETKLVHYHDDFFGCSQCVYTFKSIVIPNAPFMTINICQVSEFKCTIGSLMLMKEDCKIEDIMHINLIEESPLDDFCKEGMEAIVLFPHISVSVS